MLRHEIDVQGPTPSHATRVDLAFSCPSHIYAKPAETRYEFGSRETCV